MTDEREYLTVPDIARMLHCRPAKISGWIRAGRLRAVNLSDGLRPRYRVRRADLDDYLDRRAVVPQTRPARRGPILMERFV